MATVPYKPVSDIGASQQGIQNVDVPTPIQAFGGGIAQAIETVGKTAERAGDEIFQRAVALQQLENETLARDADTEFTIAAGERRAAFHALEGKAAVDAYPQFVADMRKMQQEARQKLTNPMARRIFDRESQSMMARTIFNGAGHSAGQNRRWAEGSSRARVDTVINDTLNDPSPTALTTGERAIRQEARNLADINGWGPEQEEQYIREANSKLLLTHLRGLARVEPFKAKEFLEKNRAKFDDRDINNAENVVQTYMRQVGSRQIISELVPPLPEGAEEPPRRDVLDAAERRARELAPSDEDFPQLVRDAVGAAISKRSATRRDDTLRNRNVVEGALMGGFGDGKLPTSVDELIATDPSVQDAWERLDNRTQRQYLRALSSNAKGEVAWTEEGLRRYSTLKGMAHDNPTEFLGVDIVNERMPSSARREMLNLQTRLRSRPEADPRVTRALQTLGPMLRSAGITRSQDVDRYYQFVGTLQDALQDYQQQHKKFPTQEEIQKMGTNLVGYQREPRTIFGIPLGQRQTPLYELSLPQQLLDEFKTDPRWQGRTPSDAEIEQYRRQYIRKRYQELFGGAASGGGAATPVPTVPMSR